MTSARPNKAQNVSLEGVDVRGLQELYTFVNGEEIARFLRGSPFLAPLLVDAKQAARRYFPAAGLRLEVATDPEIAGATHLVLSITQDGSVDRALNRLRCFDEDWWLDQIHRAQGKLVITLAFG